MDFSTITLWTGPFPIQEVSDQFLILSCNVEITKLNANSVNPNLMLHSAASDCQCPFYGMLGLNGLSKQCGPRSEAAENN